MKDKDISTFSSKGDLEGAVLSENLEAFYGIINPDLYTVLGHPPNQNVEFHNQSCFALFLIRVQEVFAEGRKVVVINNKSYNFSLLSAAIWFCIPLRAKVPCRSENRQFPREKGPQHR